ncbi:hypothetical protein LWI28_005955 [Acer negundo]|uniref:DUF4283 domain-containing protein n=1 Tax=Acer negundo TaxID=4023 RepID=A0AAD5NI92_ACENE|nr:hypothetical protein LWI28_005955 [Acer negundo]
MRSFAVVVSKGGNVEKPGVKPVKWMLRWQRRLGGIWMMRMARGCRNAFGVPLCHWNSEFFFKIGKEVGEPLMIDDDTLFKRRLHKGRLLVLMSYDISLPKFVSFNGRRGMFKLMLEEDKVLVEEEWVENFLEVGVGKLSRRMSGSSKRILGNPESQPSYFNNKCQEADDINVWQITSFDPCSRILEGGKRLAKCINQSLGMGESRCNLEKGKMLKLAHSRLNRKSLAYSHSNLKQKLILGKTKEVITSNDQTSSSSSELERGPFFNSIKSKGECSALLQTLNDLIDVDSGLSPIHVDDTGMDHGSGLNSSIMGLGSVSESKGIWFHIHIGVVSGPLQKNKKNGRSGNLIIRGQCKEAKRIQLMMKIGLLRTSQAHMRLDHYRNLAVN